MKGGFIPDFADVTALLKYLPELLGPALDPDLVEEPLRRTLYQHGWVVDFDWPEWIKAEGAVYLEAEFSEEVLQNASWSDLRKILTSMIRADRFCDGVWNQQLRQGSVRRILLRMITMRSEGSGAGLTGRRVPQ